MGDLLRNLRGTHLDGRCSSARAVTPAFLGTTFNPLTSQALIERVLMLTRSALSKAVANLAQVTLHCVLDVCVRLVRRGGPVVAVGRRAHLLTGTTRISSCPGLGSAQDAVVAMAGRGRDVCQRRRAHPVG